MTTKINLIRGATGSEIREKRFNIYIGISLGNKWFIKENIKEYILWALKHTKERVGILIADRLHAINYEIRNDEKPEKAMRRAVKAGDEMEVMIREIIAELPPGKRVLVDVMRWDVVEDYPSSQRSKKVLYKELDTNAKFREWIKKIVLSVVNHSRFNDEKIIRFTRYVIEELPELLNGFEYKGTYYNLYPYPEDSLLTGFVERLQKKELFPELHKKMQIKKNVFVELKIE